MFKDFFESSDKEEFKIETETLEEATDINAIVEKTRKKMKIRTIIPTKFGVEIVLFNPQDAKEAAKIAGTKKVDGNSIFVDD